MNLSCRWLLIGYLLVLVPGTLLGQRSLEELNQAIKNASNPRQKAELQMEASTIASGSQQINYAQAAIQTAQPLRDMALSAKAFGNIGDIYRGRRDYRTAIPYLERAITFRTSLYRDRPTRDLAVTLSRNHHDLGVCYEQIGNTDKFAYNLSRAAVYARKMARDPALAARAYNTLGEAYRRLENLEDARRAFRYAVDQAQEAGMTDYAIEMQRKYDTIERLISEKAEKLNKAEEVQGLMDDLFMKEEELEATQDSLVLVEEDREVLVEKKELLELRAAKQEAEIEAKEAMLKTKEAELIAQQEAVKRQAAQQQQIYIAIAGGGALALVIMLALIARSNARKKANRLLSAEKERSEELLLNILPAKIAEELKQNNAVAPVKHPNVSILFTDFVGFSSIAETMNEEELVEELKRAFGAFDKITAHFHLEKIKTIGDAYMAAAGLVEEDPHHALNAIAAGLAMQQWMKKWNLEQRRRGRKPWQLRVGIHSGEVIAGVVGERKYAYDIWGRAVNLASRMESAGVAGKVNVSSSTHDLVKGMVIFGDRRSDHVKNIGEVDMYFVEKIVAKKAEPAPPPPPPKKRWKLFGKR